MRISEAITGAFALLWVGFGAHFQRLILERSSIADASDPSGYGAALISLLPQVALTLGVAGTLYVFFLRPGPRPLAIAGLTAICAHIAHQLAMLAALAQWTRMDTSAALGMSETAPRSWRVVIVSDIGSAFAIATFSVLVGLALFAAAMRFAKRRAAR